MPISTSNSALQDDKNSAKSHCKTYPVNQNPRAQMVKWSLMIIIPSLITY